MKKYIVILVLVLLAIGLSFMLVPSSQEIALMSLRDKEFSNARDQYEAQAQSGNLNVEVVSNLTRLHLQYGEIDKAIAVMERFVADNPENIQARYELGRLYQSAQRPDDYVRNLEQINEIEKKRGNLKTLNEVYAASQQYEKQEPALKALVSDDNSVVSKPDQYRNLARLQASQDNAPEAVKTLLQFQSEAPLEFRFEDLEFLLSLQLEQNANDAALATAQQSTAASNFDNRQIARLINVLHYRGNPAVAGQFAADYESQIKQDIPITNEKLHLLLVESRNDEAMDLMEWLDSQGALQPDLESFYISLLAERGDMQLAKQRLERIDFASLQESDIISLIQLSLLKKDPSLYHLIESRFTAAQATVYPRAALAFDIANGKKVSINEYIDSHTEAGINPDSLLQLESICRLSKNRSCGNTVLTYLEGIDLTPKQSLQAAEFAYEGKQYELAGNWIAPLYESDPYNAEYSNLYVRLAAIKGESGTVERWLLTNPDADRKTLTDLYYISREAKQRTLALQLMETISTKYPGPESEGLLAQAYLDYGYYERALPYFRKLKDTGRESREDYAYILSKLAPKSDRYTQELVQYARQQINNPGISESEKKSLIYALINVGRPDVVMPFIGALAQSRGGEWAQIYAENLDKLGRTAEAREFRLRLAMDPKTSLDTRRSLAFKLLETGYKQDAVDIFGTLAAQSSAQSPDLQQLLFLKGVQPDYPFIEWLAGRYSMATNSADKVEWAGILADYASDDQVLAIAGQYPSLVNQPKMQQRYFDVLYQQDQLGAYGDQLLAMPDAAPEALRLYARKTAAYGLNDLSLAAYKRLAAMDVTDPEALRNVGIFAYSRADYSEVLANLLPYAEYREDNPGYHADDYQAFFTLASVMEREGDLESAKYFYNQSLNAMEVVNKDSIDSISKTAQSLIALKEEEKGLGYFDAGMVQFANDRLMRADYISSLIELQDYDSAHALMIEDKQTASLDAPINPATFLLTPMKLMLPQNDVNMLLKQSKNEVLLTFNAAIPQALTQRLNNPVAFPWLSYTSSSYDKVLIGAEEKYDLKVMQQADGLLLQPVLREDAAQARFKDELDARYAMLDARIKLETGKHYEAANELLALSKQYPQNATLLGYTANALNFTGRWKHALEMLQDAKNLMPENEDIAVLQRDIGLLRDQHVKLDYDWISIGDSDMDIWKLSGLVYVDEEMELGFNAETLDIDAQDVRRIDGRVGDFETTKQRGEIYIANEDKEGKRIQASLFANNDTLGFGLSYQWLSRLGNTRIFGEYHRPNWDFVEGILDDANRDRIGVEHQYVHNTLWSGTGLLAYNRYNLNTEDDVTDSLSVQLGVTRALLLNRPYLALNYALDAEYRLSEKTFTDNLNTDFVPLLDSREVHTLSVIGAESFTPDLEGLAQVGYSIDRFGGTGPLLYGQLTQQLFDDELEAQVRAGYGLRTGDADGDTARIGGHLKWRF